MAFGRRFPEAGEGAPLPALDPDRLPTIRAMIDHASIHQANLQHFLAAKPGGSVDRYVLLDAQDWMDDRQLNGLWAEIDRTASTGASVIFRTAGRQSVIEGRVSEATLALWQYDAEASTTGFSRDRSAIYGGFHVYRKGGAQ
ncbi:MAG: DUF3419 family protein [Phyllobacteriaceae bacterium]|nr:DUF3419 family protein [Phyllobacteriaceae bacterium]